MDWMAGLKTAFGSSSLLAAVLAGLFGTLVLLWLRRRFPRGFPQGFARGFPALGSRSTGSPDAPSAKGEAESPVAVPGTLGQAERAYREEVESPELDSRNAAEMPILPDEGSQSVPCPAEFSRRIDRIEAKLRARSAGIIG